MNKSASIIVQLLWSTLATAPSFAQRVQQLQGHILPVLSTLKPVGKMHDTTMMDIVIGLPLRDRPVFDKLLSDIYDTGSTSFHKYLKPEQYVERFCPSKNDYQQLVDWARSKKLQIVKTQEDRKILHVMAPAATVEKVFHVNLNLYMHPVENRLFYATTSEPSIDLDIPVYFISGLNDYHIPRDNRRDSSIFRRAGPVNADAHAAPAPLLTGNDFRKAYAPGVKLTGAGQVAGVLQLSAGYFASDIQAYETKNGLPGVPLHNVNVDGYAATPDPINNFGGNLECSADIELVISMAPGLSALNVYGGPYGGIHDVLHEIADPTMGESLPSVLTSSFYFFYDPNIDDELDAISAEGISFFVASGDFGSYNEMTGRGDFPPADYPRIISVGSTELQTDVSGDWASEAAANFSGGGFSPWSTDPHFAIPIWQKNLNLPSIGGSSVTRNCPDLAIVGTNISVIAGNGVTSSFAGTSASSPLWAGFAALINQQAALLENAAIGTLNQELYAIGNSLRAGFTFHDIVEGSNTNPTNPNNFHTGVGYDLVTGWGSPTGINLINYLAVISPFPASTRTVKLEFLGKSICDPGPIAGQTATYGATVSGFTPPVTFTWDETNVTKASGGTTTSPTITINVPSVGSPLGNILVTVQDALGVKASATTGVEAIDPFFAGRELRLCEILQDINRFIRPIHIWPGDPGPLEFRVDPYNRAAIQSMERLNNQLTEALKALHSTSIKATQ